MVISVLFELLKLPEFFYKNHITKESVYNLKKFFFTFCWLVALIKLIGNVDEEVDEGGVCCFHFIESDRLLRTDSE